MVLFLSICFLGFKARGQQATENKAGSGNPLLPGYFADPTIRKFGDTYYIYATTDGNGGGHGPSQVWASKDFLNWRMQDMNWPGTRYYWAPDVINADDGKYYMYYCQPVEIYGASSTSPVGPWAPLLPDGKAIIPNYFIPGVITLDGQTFKDDDGKIYMFWGTWGIYPDHGCGVGLLNADMRSFAKTAKIPNIVAKEFFEAPFMFKRKGIYYLTYSSGACENETYRVQYATSKTGPMGPFVFGKNNPVLATNADGSVHGPGHQSVVQVGNDYYMVYHRHNNPHSNGGYHRQVCADKLVFDGDGNIEKMVPTHSGVGLLGKNTITSPNLAYQKAVTASSSYSNNYLPAFAVDDNNGTLWKPADNSTKPAQLIIDLGKQQPVKQILTSFEYATWYYQYYIEASADGKSWTMFADRRLNHRHGSPMVDNGNSNARFIRLTISDTEYPGLYKALWNIKVYGREVIKSDTALYANGNKQKNKDANAMDSAGIKNSIAKDPKMPLIDIDAASLPLKASVIACTNNGSCGGVFKTDGKPPVVDIVAGKKAFVFNGTQSLQSSAGVPVSLWGNNSYTVDFWAYCKVLKDENPLISWTDGDGDHTGATFGYGDNKAYGAAQHFGVSDFPYAATPGPEKWHHIVITFDGSFEKVFVDGLLNNQENKMLFLKPTGKFVIGAKMDSSAYFSGALSALKVYDYPVADAAIAKTAALNVPADVAIYLDAAKLNYGPVQLWPNDGDTGGGFAAKAGVPPMVKDVDDKIAVAFSGGQQLQFNKAAAGVLGNTMAYSIAYSIYNSSPQQDNALNGWFTNTAKNDKLLSAKMWHYVVKCFDGKLLKHYVDGYCIATTPVAKAESIAEFLSIGNLNKDKTDAQVAISSLVLYRHSLSPPEIEELTGDWKKNRHPLLAIRPSFKISPHAITPGIVQMEAATAPEIKTSLQYNFIEKDGKAKPSGWANSPVYTAYGLGPNQQYHYLVKVKDDFGNVSSVSAAFLANTSTRNFLTRTDNFTNPRNFITQGTSGTLWQGLMGLSAEAQSKIKVDSGSLLLQSKGTNWDGNKPYGPFLYQQVQGDFVVEVEVIDLSGLQQKKVTGNNDIGIMVRKKPFTDTVVTDEQLIQNSIFPAWNCGNLFTNFKNGQRMQVNTQAGWNYDRFLQIQKAGELFYIRKSKDGISWTDMPNSPVTRPDLKSAQLQVGLYQSSYGPQQSYARFAGYKLYILK
ncbi:family 43 glycosylhydrolase [Mucilaginibacter phyllosphaerae]|uniref:F5/8 type C domain-containing protein n=1 Tax=Mucilaginibacter phyllosphaerae TaxID=1812349 RepID=A0ABR6I8X4_9SPHI|nr:family 43 glycosylhydrolase [Mucilaginibacter phyllosphaerae]MBB3969495.1 hypothetical protein [Mucilaginibacter phyllosphaerae]